MDINYCNICTDNECNVETVLQLGNNPTYKFDGDVLNYVELRTLFKHAFETRFCDLEILFTILLKHLIGNVALTVQVCLYERGVQKCHG